MATEEKQENTEKAEQENQEVKAAEETSLKKK